jgi:hypothetical protein
MLYIFYDYDISDLVPCILMDVVSAGEDVVRVKLR